MVTVRHSIKNLYGIKPRPFSLSCKKSKALQDAIGYKPTRMTFKALGLHCGMFYTDRDDLIGLLLQEQLYGDKVLDENFRQYLNPENEEIFKNLPPVFLITSKRGFY